MKHFKRFNEAEIPNPHAWRNKPAAEKETNVLDMVRGGDVNALEDFLHANEADLKRNVTMAAKFSAPGTRHQNNEIYDYVMDHYNDIIDMEAVAKWLKYDTSHRDYVAAKSNRRDIDSEGNDWYGFDHPEDMKESNSMKYIKSFEGVIDYLNQQHLAKNADNLTIMDIVKQSDIYCGNHIDKENNKICGYYFGEIDDSVSKDSWAREILKEKCPDCGMQAGKKVMYVSQKDLNEYEENLPGEGFYIFPKSYEEQ